MGNGFYPELPMVPEGFGAAGYDPDEILEQSWSNTELSPEGLVPEDPMQISIHGTVTRPSDSINTQDGVNFLGISTGGTGARVVFDGAPALNPGTRKPFNALRIFIIGPGQDPGGGFGTDPVIGAELRITCGDPTYGARVSRTFVVEEGPEAVFMAGKYGSVRLEVLSMQRSCTLFWMWYEDNSGVPVGTPLQSRMFQQGAGVKVRMPNGATDIIVDRATNMNWFQGGYEIGGVFGENGVFGAGGVTPAVIGGQGNLVLGQKVSFSAANVAWTARLAPI